MNLARWLWRRFVWGLRVVFILGVAGLSPFAPPTELPPPPPAEAGESDEDDEEP